MLAASIELLPEGAFSHRLPKSNYSLGFLKLPNVTKAGLFLSKSLASVKPPATYMYV